MCIGKRLNKNPKIYSYFPRGPDPRTRPTYPLSVYPHRPMGHRVSLPLTVAHTLARPTVSDRRFFPHSLPPPLSRERAPAIVRKPSPAPRQQPSPSTLLSATRAPATCVCPCQLNRSLFRPAPDTAALAV
jgi:hypothetical protein